MAGNNQSNAQMVTASQEEPPACSLARLIDLTTTPLAVDPEAEWDQQIIAGLNRMDIDPVFREAVRRRTT